MAYALLQVSLDQTITRAELEEASMAAPSVARADCALLQKELFGIVVDNLEHDEALALQAALRARNFPTELVEQSTLPVLPPPKREKALRLSDAGIAVVDLYGGEQLYTGEQIVFAAAGYTTRMRQRVAGQHEEVVYRGRVTATRTVTDYRLQDVPEFRLETFFAVEPYRLQWILDPDNTLNVNSRIVTLRKAMELDEPLKQLATFCPADRLNLGIRRLNAGEYFVYPSVRAFEEEIVWSFYRLTRAF